MTVIKKTDFAEIRNACMRIIKNRESQPNHVSSCSRAMIALREQEMRIMGTAPTNRRAREVNEVGEPLVDALPHLLKIATPA